MRKVQTPMVNKVLAGAQRFLCHTACYLCHHTINQSFPLCRQCLANLPRLSAHHCPICGENITIEQQICGACLRKTPYFDRVIATFSFTKTAKHIVHEHKFDKKLYWSPLMARLMLQQINKSMATKPDLLCVVPTHPHKLRQRGFNPSAELAKPLAKWLNKPLLLTEVIKTRHTPDQAGLSRKQRIGNLNDAFDLTKSLAGNVLIVDDVVTTGTTIDTIAQLLKRRGAKQVFACCFARTQRT